MATMTNSLANPEILRHGYDEALNRYIVVHPLDDLPEEKVRTEELGPMSMTRSVRWSLLSLRGYLILMCLLVLFHVLQLAGLAGAVR
jgi:hypothetical protein